MIVLDKTPWFDVRSFKTVFTYGERCTGVAVLRGKYSLSFDYDPTTKMLRCRYEQGGQVRSMTVEIREEQPNLGIGKMYWFVCPITWRKCRKLYVSGGRIVSRFGLPGARYSYQNKTASLRIIDRYNKYCDIPLRKYGKPYYRGRLTPYGKRIMRYEQRCEDAENIICLTMMPMDELDGTD